MGAVSRWLVPAMLVAAVALLSAPGATAKDFGPGDLRICNAHACIPVVRRQVLPLLGRFYYSSRFHPRKIARAHLGARMFRLEFRNGYVTGIVATRRLDRFLSYGVDLGRFRRGTWYRLPPRFAAELRRLATRLRPLRLTRAAVKRSR